MKKFFIGTLIAFTALAFTSENNLTKSLGLFTPKEEKLTINELDSIVRVKVTDTLRSCMMQANPHLFMTKCYAGFDLKTTIYDVNSGRRVNKSLKFIKEDEFDFYKRSDLTLSLLFADCGREELVATLFVNYSKNEILVKESFFSKTIPSEKFIEDFCEKYSNLQKKDE